MSRIKKTEGIVIKTKDLTETSQIVWFYTKDFGKIKIVAKGSRKRSKRFKSKLDLFSRDEIVFYYNSRSELHMFSEGGVIDPFTEIRSDINRMALASYIVELTDACTGLEDKHENIYFLVIETLKWLAVVSVAEFWFLKCVFEIKLLQFSGDFKIPGNTSRGAAAIVEKIMNFPSIDIIRKVKVSETQLEELKKSVGLVVDFSVGKRLKSLDFLEEMMEPGLRQTVANINEHKNYIQRNSASTSA